MRRGSRIAGSETKARMIRAVEALEGRSPAIAGLIAERAAGLLITDFRALPARPGAPPLHNASGQFYFLPDYSAPGGPDILAP